MEPLNEVDLKIRVKNHEEVIESMEEFMTTRISINERDSRVGHIVKSAGMDTANFTELLPERWYTFCFYLETHYSEITSAVCESFQTKQWGTITKAKISFSSPPLLDENLNKVLCFFTKEVDTEILYLLDL